jgi:hypothetical protein
MLLQLLAVDPSQVTVSATETSTTTSSYAISTASSNTFIGSYEGQDGDSDDITVVATITSTITSRYYPTTTDGLDVLIEDYEVDSGSEDEDEDNSDLSSTNTVRISSFV